MKRIFAMMFVVVLVLGLSAVTYAVSYDDEISLYAVEYDPEEMTVIDTFYHVSGSVHVIYRDPDGVFWYFIDGARQKRTGLVFVGGCYYYVRTNGDLAVNEYYISNGNGLLPVGGYTFDAATARMVDPPLYPDDWANEWSSSPFVDDSGVVDISFVSGLFTQVFSSVAGWFIIILSAVEGSSTLVFASIFMLWGVIMIYLPLRGSGASDRAKRKDNDA